MEAEKFRKDLLENSDEDYGLCWPPTKAQDGLNILIKHFLGDDWYTTMPMNGEQVNSEAIYEILKQNKKGLLSRIFG